MRRWRDIATIANKKGLDGGLVLNVSANPSLHIEEGMEFAIVPPQLDIPRQVCVADVYSATATSYVVYFDGIDDASSAEPFIGCHCLIDASVLNAYSKPVQAASEFSETLIGWTIQDKTSGFVGTVVDAQDRFEQILLSVQESLHGDTESSVKLIPLTDSIIVDIDSLKKHLVLDCPPGLLEL